LNRSSQIRQPPDFTLFPYTTLFRSRCRRAVRLKVTARTMSPAVCGLFRPVILLPQALVGSLTPAQLRAVLVHELIHLRRGDVWRSEEHTSELQSRRDLVCRLLLEKK